MKDVQIKLLEEECVVDMVQSGRLVDMKDVPTMPSEEEFVEDMVHTRSNKSSRAEIKLISYIVIGASNNQKTYS